METHQTSLKPCDPKSTRQTSWKLTQVVYNKTTNFVYVMGMTKSKLAKLTINQECEYKDVV